MIRNVYVFALVWALPLQAQKPLTEAIRDLATQITTSASKQEKTKIAVLPFRELDGQPTILGTYLSEELVTNLFQLGNFKIVERQLLDKVLGELKIQQSGAIDPSAAKEIGRIAAVDAIVTGSITDLETFVAVNCRLIDTATGEVFGAAQTKIAKDEDVNKSIRTAREPGGLFIAPSADYQTSKAIASKDAALLRVVLKSVLPVSASPSYEAGLMCTLELINRDARRPIVVALNAAPPRSGDDYLNEFSQVVSIRSALVDDRGGVWKASAGDLSGIGFVRVGVHGKNGGDIYQPEDVTRLLRLRDELGRDRDDPSDGFTARADSVGEGGMNVTFGSGGITSPPKFFAYRGNRFISGTTSIIEPGQTLSVTIRFHDESGSSGGRAPEFFQFSSEIVVGSGDARRRSYSLHNVTFDRVGLRH